MVMMMRETDRTARDNDYNAGYADGYYRLPPDRASVDYIDGYMVGLSTCRREFASIKNNGPSSATK